MEDELLAKMHGRIDAGVTCEEDLLFLLVKMRKLLERKELKRDYPALLFYCDWSVHAVMDRQGAKDMLRQVDELIDRYLDGNRDTLREVAALLSLAGLRTEIRRFCGHFGLPPYVVAYDDTWNRFRELFVRNISDCPLILNGPSRHVRSLSFVLPTGEQTGNDGPYVRIELTDGQALELAIT
jgi:hypothetical protein